MKVQLEVIPKKELSSIVPLLAMLNEYKISEAILKERVAEMAIQQYDCIGIFHEQQLIGICGIWFQTRHYAGKSMEIDHVIIKEEFRNKGIGERLMKFVYEIADQRNCQWVELNTYVHNFASHKFYYNQGFVAKGYHFVKPLIE